MTQFQLFSRVAFMLAAFLVYTPYSLAEDKPVTAFGEIIRLESRIDKIIPQGAALEKIADGFNWVEGPVWHNGGKYLLFTDIPANSVYKWQEGKGVSLFLRPSGYSGKKPFKGREPGANGLLFDFDGSLLLCEHGDRRISRLSGDGQHVTVVDRYKGKRLNSPNDAVLNSDGDLYFTDPPFGLPKTFKDPKKELKFSGVYRLNRDGELTLLLKDINAPNGIAFSPTEHTLYLTDVDPKRPAILAYNVNQDGTLGSRWDFFDARELMKSESGAPDGLKVDEAGHIYNAGPGGVHIFSPDGTRLGFIRTGVATSNLAWGDDGKTLYITASTAVYRIKLNIKGNGFY